MTLPQWFGASKRCGNQDSIAIACGFALGATIGIWLGFNLATVGRIDEAVQVRSDYGQASKSAAESKLATSPTALIVVRNGAIGNLAYKQGPYNLVDFRVLMRDEQIIHLSDSTHQH